MVVVFSSIPHVSTRIVATALFAVVCCMILVLTVVPHVSCRIVVGITFICSMTACH